ncbi:MAG: hypothetical protein Kow0047_24280 [Anaerolineae bacterium]
MLEMSNGNGKGQWEEPDIQTEVTPLTLSELQAWQGHLVQGLALWDESIADAELDAPISDDERIFVDFDLYLEGQGLLEVFAATVYASDSDEPLMGLETIADALGDLTERGASLVQVTTDDEDGLVLILATPDGDSLLVAPSGWIVTHWEELPDEADWDVV